MEVSDRRRSADRNDPGTVLEHAGLTSRTATSWRRSELRVTGNFKRDAAAASKFWRSGADLIGKLPTKRQRTSEQQSATEYVLAKCRAARETFLVRHGEAIYRKLTRNHSSFLRV